MTTNRKPDRREFPELPIRSFTDWDRVQLVKDALTQLERGSFNQASMIVDAMGRDDRIKGVLTTRVQGLLSLPVSFESQGDKRRGKKAMEAVEKGWEAMFPKTALADLLSWGLMLGFGLGELVWDLGDQWTPRLKVWHPQFVYWRWDTWTYWLITRDETMEIHPGDGKWVAFAPYGLDRSFFGGLVRSLGMPWLLRQWAYRDWARYDEIHGLPLVKALVPAEASEEDKEKFFQEVVCRGSEAVVQIPKRPDGTGYDLELLEATANSHLAFQHLLERTESSIAIAILGQNLTTEVKGGSFAAASVHDRVRRDFIEADASSLATTLRDQVLKQWAAYNFGDPELAPLVKFDTEPPEDESESSKSMASLGMAVVALKKAGAPVDLEALLEQFDIPISAEPLSPPPPAPVFPQADHWYEDRYDAFVWQPGKAGWKGEIPLLALKVTGTSESDITKTLMAQGSIEHAQLRLVRSPPPS